MAYQFFVETDTLFGLALQSFARLNQDGQLTNIAYKQVTVPIVLNSTGVDLFTRLYDFTRTAAVTARALFIDATGLKVDYPVTQSWPHNSPTKVSVSTPGYETILSQLNGQEIYSRYDQLTPHYRLETDGPPFSRKGIIIAFHDGAWHLYQVRHAMFTSSCKLSSDRCTLFR